MPRTVISLPDDDKEWLDRRSAAERVSMTELVRRAVREYRLRHGDHHDRGLEELLEMTRGRWRHGDGLQYQDALREEWDRDG